MGILLTIESLFRATFRIPSDDVLDDENRFPQAFAPPIHPSPPRYHFIYDLSAPKSTSAIPFALLVPIPEIQLSDDSHSYTNDTDDANYTDNTDETNDDVD